MDSNELLFDLFPQLPDDCIHVIVQCLAEHRCDRELAELRGTARRYKRIVDRTWRNMHKRFAEMGLPVPRLCRDVAPNQIGKFSAVSLDDDDFGPLRMQLYKLVEARDLKEIREYMELWGSVPLESDIALYEAIRIDFPECIPLIMPLIQLCMDMFINRTSTIDRWREMFTWTIDSVFVRWAPFFYWLYPVVESDATDLLSRQVCWDNVHGESVETTYRDGLITLRNKPRTVQWIETNWTAENKQRVEAMDKWWIRDMPTWWNQTESE